MVRSAAAKSVMSMAAAAGIFLFSPMALHASALSPSAGDRASVTPDTSPYVLVWTGYTYPDTQAGLSACDAEGTYLESHSQYRDIVGYNCTLYEGEYDLYLIQYDPAAG
jgi:hypothetical protein